MSPGEIDELTMWQYTGLLAEHNSRIDQSDPEMKPWTAEEYQAELEALRARDDPQIRV